MKRTLGKCIKGVTLVSGAVFLTNMGAMALLSNRDRKKMEKHENENNLQYAYSLRKEDIQVKPEVQNAYFTAINSSLTIRLPRPEKEQMNVEITSYLSKVNIILPADVNVKCDGSDHLNYSCEEKEGLPVIHLIVHDHLSMLTVEDA